jgi:hypothetical protein
LPKPDRPVGDRESVVTDRKDQRKTVKGDLSMRINYVLIDFENVQPESLAVLQHEHFKVMVFVGTNQAP